MFHNLNSLQIKFLFFIALVFVVTASFAVLIWRQTLVVEEKALAAKRRQQEYQKQAESGLPPQGAGQKVD